MRFEERVENVLPVPNVFNTIAEMNALLSERVWVVSKAALDTERKAREWLKYHRFFESTGVSLRDIRFVRDRSRKLDACRELGITHFVDDGIKNLELLAGSVEHLYLFSGDFALQGVCAVRDWADLGYLLRESIEG